ncbi:Protein N-acetyltransferase, RimJ/RimL family [Pseudarthrobacter equi]|uniref:Protein N-acetyltransferase, RimJ/RimL family n=1 Tax=Pseudarthrobacter equi TaxID=728066 RepID=A0A1H1YYH2_9MICC|nr:GNAT family N-acetyltransferase [Pseudarthrobacter equi]SDT26463.1 Protein N-acetyltransferase, RimJ/RimL family [Pseudarthrobacter equi]
MFPTPEPPRSPGVTLVDVDELVLEQLLSLAHRDASPDEVAPPMGGPGWNPERTAWFRNYHREAAAGLDGAAGEKSWAVFSAGHAAGFVRLKRIAPAEVPTAETGIWLGRSYRSRGIGTAALTLVLDHARSAGLSRVTARTLAGNRAAQQLLASAGCRLTPDDDGTVLAVVDL